MAARLNPRHDAKTREKIQTSQLINRLNKFVKGDVEMSSQQVTAALGLLRKSLPDLSAVDQTTTHDVSDPMKELLEHIAVHGSGFGPKS